MRTLSRIAAVAFLTLVGSHAGAAIITHTATFAQGSGIINTRFDPGLGTLERVEWTISGTLSIRVSTQPFGTPPTPYNFAILLEEGFTGFSVRLNSTAQYVLFGTASGAGETVDLQVPLLFRADFTPTTDMTGGSVPIMRADGRQPFVVPFLSGLRRDFLSNSPGSSGPLFAGHFLHPLFFDALAPVTPFMNPQDGSLSSSVLYEYTPASTAPEPATAFLLFLGLAFLRARTRKP